MPTSAAVRFTLVALLALSPALVMASSSSSSDTKKSHKKHSRKASARRSSPVVAERGWNGVLDGSAAHASAPAVADGATERLSNDQINHAVASHRSEIMGCVNLQRQSAGPASGTLEVRWTIDPSGETRDVAAVTPDLSDSKMAQCMTELILGWRFEAHAQPQEPITFPFRF